MEYGSTNGLAFAGKFSYSRKQYSARNSRYALLTLAMAWNPSTNRRCPWLCDHGCPVARDTSTPDWLCVQRKIEKVTSTQVWEGPAVDDNTGWRQDTDVNKLVELLANRRVPSKDADAAIKKFANSLPEAARTDRLTLVFAGLFAKLLDSGV